MQIFLIAIGAFLFTLLGGFLTTKIKDKKHLLLAFSAGTVLAVSFFDLLPESLEMTTNTNVSLLFTVIGFGVYFLLNNWLTSSVHKDGDCCDNKHHMNLGTSSLVFHSMLDGIGIGLAFQASPVLGAMVAAGVLVHDFSDGINTATMSKKHGDTMNQTKKWVTLDALAPSVGIILSSFIHVPGNVMGVLFALFAGFFLYIAASDLVPECHHEHPKFLTGVMFFLGLGTLWTVMQIAGK